MSIKFRTEPGGLNQSKTTSRRQNNWDLDQFSSLCEHSQSNIELAACVCVFGQGRPFPVCSSLTSCLETPCFHLSNTNRPRHPEWPRLLLCVPDTWHHLHHHHTFAHLHLHRCLPHVSSSCWIRIHCWLFISAALCRFNGLEVWGLRWGSLSLSEVRGHKMWRLLWWRPEDAEVISWDANQLVFRFRLLSQSRF